MGNCICKYNCFYASRIAETFRDSDLRSLVLSIDESRVNLFRSSQHGGRLSWQSQASSSDDFVDQELDEVRKKIDGLIGSDLFAFQGICKTVRLPFWEADSVCECQKHLVKKGGSYFIVSSIVSSKHSATEYMKGSKPTSELWMHIVTWNMNGKMAYDDLSKLVATDKEQYDLYVVGLQEVPNCEVEIAILETLGDDFSLVAAAIMPSLRLYIFARKSLDPYLEDKRVDKVGVGGFGAVVRRQKGAVAVSMKYKDASLLFVTSHLSPHESNVEERNSQYQRISQSLFSRTTPRIYSCLKNSVGVEDESGYGAEAFNSSSLVEDAELVIWLGDLNYRIEESRSSVDVLINKNLFKDLWCKDQLFREVQKGQVFKDFCEGPLSFRPTYKYDIGTDNYDTSAKERVPSWTDRILYKVNKTSCIKAEVYDYDSIDSVKSSDHRPVKALVKLDGLTGC